MKPIKIPTRWMMAALLGLTLAGPVAGQDGTDPFELFKLFNFCQPVRLVVAPFVDLDEDAAIGLTSEPFRKRPSCGYGWRNCTTTAAAAEIS